MKQLITLFITFSTLSIAMASTMEDALKFLSSDQQMGRRAGSIQNQTATDYLAQKFQDLGLKPLGQNHFQEFTIFTRMVKNGANHLVINGMNASFEPISFSLSNDVIDAPLVFAGFGISIPGNDPKLTYDDYSALDVKGKVLIVMTGDPGIGNTGSLFRDPAYLNYQSVNYKLTNAAAHGASGVILVQDPMSIIDLNNESAPYFNDQEGGGARFQVVSGMSTNKFLKTLSIDTLTLQKKIAATQAPSSFEVTGLKVNLSVHLKKETGRVSNVLGVLPGTDATLKNEVIVLGAHFDHLGLGGQSSMEPDRNPKIHNGADDNASGTSLVLALAEKLSKTPQKRTIIFALFNAEEEGLLGSQQFVANWPSFETEYGSLSAMLNFDMVGRFDKKVSLMGTATAFEWVDILSTQTRAPALPFETTKLAVGSSDHYSFIQGKVPALFFTTGAHPDYHRASDDFEKIDFKAMTKILDHALNLTQVVAGDTVITFDPDSLQGEDPGRNRGYGAHLGCVPMFGQPDDVIGVTCTRVSAGSPAEAAGIIDGDVVIQVGDVEIKNIYDLVFALKYYRAGDEVELVWKRGAQVMRKMIKLTTKTPVKSLNDLHTGGHEHSCHMPPIL